MLIEQIREGTREKHQALENGLFPFINGITDRKDYARLLKAFYGFMAPVEERIHKYIDAGLIPDIGERRNAALLLRDLETAGSDTDIPWCEDLPDIHSNASAFGALYVLEGSTLGGKTIAKMIGSSLGADAPLQFFSGYGPDTGKMWKAFMQYLEHPALAPTARETVDTAEQTFSLFGAWLEKQLPVQ